MRRAIDEFNLGVLPSLDRKFLNAHWRDLRFNFFDCETTGLDPANDEIIQFVSVVTQLGSDGMEVLSTTDLYFKPRTAIISPEIVKITGITNDRVAECGHFDVEAVRKALTLGDVLVGYNVLDFDYDFINESFKRKDVEFPQKPMADLIFWCRHHFKKYSKVKQGDMARKFGVARMAQVEHGKESLHNALTDCMVGSELLWALSKEVIGVWSLSDLLSMQANLYEEQNNYLMKKYGN